MAGSWGPRLFECDEEHRHGDVEAGQEATHVMQATHLRHHEADSYGAEGGVYRWHGAEGELWRVRVEEGREAWPDCVVIAAHEERI